MSYWAAVRRKQWAVCAWIVLAAAFPGAVAADGVAPLWQETITGAQPGIGGIQIGDLNGDGRPELVTANSQGYVLLYRGDAQGYRLAWSSRHLPGGVEALEIADVDGGGSPELLVAIPGQVLLVDGTSLRETGVIDLPNSDRTRDLACGDLDGDGVTEIAVARYDRQNGASSTILYAAQDGFPLRATLPVGGSEIAIGSVDGDAAPELVCSDGYVVDGATLQVEWSYWPATFGQQVRLYDLDGDGRDEIFATRYQTLLAYDAVEQTIRWQTPIDVTNRAESFTLADLNGDGTPEAVTGSDDMGGISVYDLRAGSRVAMIATTLPGTRALACADLDGDGAPEIASVAGSSEAPAKLRIADTRALDLYGSPNAMEWQSENLDGGFYMLAVADLDRDGRRELVTASETTDGGAGGGALLVLDGTTRALKWRSEPASIEGQPAEVACVKVRDINRDGTPEIWMLLRTPERARIAAIDGVTHAPFWDSGDLAVVVVRKKTIQITSRKKTTKLTFDVETNSFPSSFEVGDPDDDGHPEVLVGFEHGIVQVIDAATHTLEWTTPETGGTVTDVAVANVDTVVKNKKPDSEIIIQSSTDPGTVFTVWSMATRKMKFQVAGAKEETETAPPMMVANVDGDAGPELVTAVDGVIQIYDFNTKAYQTSFAWELPVAAISAADVNGNGTLDLVVCSPVGERDGASGRVIALTDQGQIMWQSDLRGLELGRSNGLSVADLNGDGKAEVVAGGASALMAFDGNPSLEDLTPPETRILTGPTATASTTPLFTVAGADNVTLTPKLVYSWSLDGGQWSPFAASTLIRLTGVTAGAHVLAVRARDLAGNTDPLPATAQFVVDPTPPETTIASGPPAEIASTTVTIEFAGHDDLTADEKLQFAYRMDGAAWTNLAGVRSVKLTGLAEGTHKFEVVAVDEANNPDGTPAVSEFTVALRRGTIRGEILDTRSEFVPNAEVRVMAGTRVVATATTNESGQFEIAVAEGDYTLVAKAEGFLDWVSGTVHVDTSPVLASMLLIRPGSIRVSALGAGRAEMPGAEVRLALSGKGFPKKGLVTGEDGAVEFPGLAPGVYQVKVIFDGVEHIRPSIRVMEGKRTETSVRVAKGVVNPPAEAVGLRSPR